MNPTLTLASDTITPDLRKKLSAVSGGKLTQVWRSAGMQLLSITKGAFRNAGNRQQAWPSKRDGKPSNLIAKGTLLASVRVVSVDSGGVTLGSDRPYARIHQLGGTIRAKGGGALRFFSGGKWWTVKSVTIPARPFLPFTPDGDIHPKFQVKVRNILGKALEIALR